MTELVVQIQDASMMPRLRRVIKSLQGVGKVYVPRSVHRRATIVSSVRMQLTKRLKELAALSDNWDDEGAFAIDKGVVSKVKKLIAHSGAEVLSDWILFPEPNGTIQLKSRSHRAVITIGATDYSYVSRFDDVKESANHQKFTPSSIIKLVNHINGQGSNQR